jgi:hypothetical protein
MRWVRRKSTAESQAESKSEWQCRALQRAKSPQQSHSDTEMSQFARNASESMNEIIGGMAIHVRSGASQACHSIRVNRESDSNEIDESDPQYEKHDEQRIPTVRGIMIDRSDEDENADDSIRVNRESDSNEIDESELQSEKHSEQRISTVRGIMID